MKKCDCLVLAVLLLLLTGCGQPHTHTFGEWATVKPAECTAEGLQERVCPCGERESKSLAAEGHNLDDLGVCAACGYGAENSSGLLVTGSSVKTQSHKFTVGKIAFVGGLKEKVGDTVYAKGEGHMLVIQLEFTNLAEEAFDHLNSPRVSDMTLEYGGKFHYAGEFWVPGTDIPSQATANLYITYEVPKSVAQDKESSLDAVFTVDGRQYRVTVQEGGALTTQEQQPPQQETDDGLLQLGESCTDGENFSVTLEERFYTDSLTADVGNVTYTKELSGRTLVLRLRFKNLAAGALDDWGSDRIRDMRLIHAEEDVFSGNSWIPAQQILPLEENDLYVFFAVPDGVETGAEPLVATFTVDGTAFSVNCRK